MAGEVDKLKGRAKEAIGKAVGNRRLAREGKRDRAVGAVKDKISKIEHAVEDKIEEKLDEAKDALKRDRADS